jgi:hypothetical protein
MNTGTFQVIFTNLSSPLRLYGDLESEKPRPRWLLNY